MVPIKNEVSIFTVCNVAYLDKAMVLSESLYKHNNLKLEIFLFDKKREISINQDYCNIHWVEELNVLNFSIFSFKYNVIELTTSLKPYITLLLLKYSKKVIFFDPDIMIFNSLRTIIDELDHYPIIITPHYFIPKINGLADDDRLMKFGCYNLGFFAVQISDKSFDFLNWWSERCMKNGFDDTQFGIFTDQKWINLAQCFFPSIYVSYNPGLNVAYWNIDERVISKNSNNEFVINDGYQLIFFHFSSFDSNSPENLSKTKFNFGNNQIHIIKELTTIYITTLHKYSNISSDMSYAYDYMSDGKYISPTLRRAYASQFDQFKTIENPFDSNSEVSIFAKKNHLFARKNLKYENKGYDSISKNKFAFKIVFIFMKIILWIIGPNRFMNFSKLLIYLSAYHRNSKMWKI